MAIPFLVPDGEAGTTHLRLLSNTAEALMDEDLCAQIKASTDASRIVNLLSAHIND